METYTNSKRKLLVGMLAVFAAFIMAIPMFAGRVLAQDQWPQEVTIQDGRISVYEPQIEFYKGDRVKWRAALSIQGKDDKEPVFGVAWLSARALTDRETRMVEFKDVEVEHIKFPQSTSEQEKKWTEVLSQNSDKWVPKQVELDRLLALTAAVEKGKAREDRLNMNPPKIIFTTTPSALIVINGKPELRKVEGSGFERVINTPFLILFDPPSATYYTKGGDFWYSATNVTGPWKHLNDPPRPVIDVAGRIIEPRENKDADQAKPKVPPEIIVATEPTELIVSEGKPIYAAVQGTDLLYMSNTPSEVFMEIRNQEYYVLLAGRWYQSRSLEKGPWAYVPSQNLPQDFKRIPPGSSKGHVLAFVAGTTEAEEAVLDAQTPETTAVKRSEAKLSVSYDGNPKFEPIKDTDMQYAVNTKTQVVKVKDKYYAVDEAIWYVSESPTGPWVVADTLPPEIDDIPPDSPVYNVKYVRVYDSTPEVVYVGYTPGYLGSYVYGDSIVYGTGYSYPGWTGSVYYPAPLTWGFAPIYDPYYYSWGFGWGYGAGFVSGFFWGFPVGIVVSPWWYGCYWGGWYPWYGYGYGYGYPWRGWYFGYRHYAHYGHYGHYGYGHNGYHGNYHGNYPGNHNPGDRYAHGNINRPINIRPGTQGPGRPVHGQGPGPSINRSGHNTYQRQGPTANLRPGQNPRRPGETPYRPSNRNVNPRQGNNIYAGRDGNVYRRTPQGWEQRAQGGWVRPEARSQTSQNFERYRPGLDRDYGARMRGAERAREFGRPTGGFGGGNPGRGVPGGGNRAYMAPGGGSYRGAPGFGGGAPMGGGSRSGGHSGGGFGGPGFGSYRGGPGFGGGSPMGGGSRSGGHSGGGFGGPHGGGPRR